jgi:hypothetical protein
VRNQGTRSYTYCGYKAPELCCLSLCHSGVHIQQLVSSKPLTMYQLRATYRELPINASSGKQGTCNRQACEESEAFKCLHSPPLFAPACQTNSMLRLMPTRVHPSATHGQLVHRAHGLLQITARSVCMLQKGEVAVLAPGAHPASPGGGFCVERLRAPTFDLG